MALNKHIFLLIITVLFVTTLSLSLFMLGNNDQQSYEENKFIDTEVGSFEVDFFKMSHKKNIWEGVTVPYDPNQTVEFVGKPGQDGGYNNNTWVYETNSIGLRESEIKKEKPELRILLLGNSDTLGQGVKHGERYSDLLEEELTDSQKGEAEVINAGIDLAGMIDHYIFVTSIGMEIEPDLVIIGDIVPGTDMSRAERKKMTNEIEQRSYGENTPGSMINRITSNIGNKYEESHNLWTEDGDILKYLNKTYNHLNSNDIDLIISCSKPCNSNIHAWSENKETSVIESPPEFEEKNKSFYRYEDGHLNEKGHRIVAENIYRNTDWKLYQ